MKNLKKVLALVLCCAMVFGVVATAAGTNYPDVPADATYAEAVEVLSSFGIIEGDDEGNFNPDATITRAEMAKILYTIVSRADVSKTATKFTDVPAEHWASGYVAYCAQLGYIDGYDATTFGPEDPVTYEQVLKLVLCAMGYKPAADFSGGYPTGYLMVGADIGLTKGLTNITGPDPAPRSIVAMAVYNAINTPIMKQVNYGSDAKYVPMDGSLEANYVFQTLLNKVYNTYKVEGIVRANSQTSLVGDLDLNPGYVRFDVTNTLKVDPVDLDGSTTYPTVDNPIVLSPAMAEGTGADALLGRESVAYVTSEDGDYTIVSIVSKANRNIETVIPAADQIYDATKDFSVNERDQFNLTTGNSNSRLIYSYWNDRGADNRIQTVEVNGNTEKPENSAVVLWNGKLAGNVSSMDADLLTPYEEDSNGNMVFNSDNRVRPQVGSVVLVDVDNDGKVDIIDCKSYGVGVVRSVNANSGRIQFENRTSEVKTVVLDKDENPDLKEWSITLNGEEIGIEEIQENDVLNICTNDFKYPTFFEIIVTRNAVQGRVTEVDSANNRYGIVSEDGSKDGLYRITDGISGLTALEIEDQGVFYLDMDGRIAAVDTSGVLLGNYGYILKVGNTNFDGEFEISLLTSEGSRTTFSAAERLKINGVSTKNADTEAFTKGDINEIFEEARIAGNYTPFETDLDKPVTVSDLFATYEGYQATDGVTPKILLHALSGTTTNYVVAPTLNTNLMNAMSGDVKANAAVSYSATDGQIKAIDIVVNAPSAKGIFNLKGSGSAIWRETTGRFGSTSVSDNALVFFVGGDTVSNYQVRGIDYFRDDKIYSPIILGDTSNGAAVIIMTSGSGTYDAESSLAVFASSTDALSDDDEEIKLITYYENGVEYKDKDRLKVSDSCSVTGERSSVAALKPGDVFFYSTDAKGLVDQIFVVIALGSAKTDAPPLVAGEPNGFRELFSIPTDDEGEWGWIDDGMSRAVSKFYFGYLASSFGDSKNGIAIDVMGADGNFSKNAVTIMADSSTPTLFYYPSRSLDKNRIEIGEAADIEPSDYGVLNDKDIDFDSEDTSASTMKYIFARYINDEVAELIVIDYAN